MNVDLPSENPPDNVGNIPLADGKGKVNLFRLMCAFAVIASKVYRQLYSVKASKQSDGELLNTIGELDKELEEWKDGIPIDFRPEHEIKASHTPLILHVVVLHFAYYNCLTTIHRMSVHHGYWTSRLSDYAIQGLNARPLNPRVFSSAALCVSAARASIHLIKYVPQGDYDCVWLILYYPVSALVTLFANILQNPHDSRARSDLKLINQVVSFLSMLCEEDQNSSVRRMYSVCSEFERIARVVLDKTEKDAGSRRKRKVDPSDDSGKGSVEPTSPTHGGGHGHRQSVASTADPLTPQPSQPGNIPNVFTPPDYSKYLGEDVSSSPGSTGSHRHLTEPQAYNSMNDIAMSSLDPTGGAWLSPGQNGIQQPGASGVPSSSTFEFSAGGASIGINNGVFAGPGQGGMSLGNSFGHPFVPQDLWQMPMTLDWDWADMTGMGGGSMGFGGGMPAAAAPNGVGVGGPPSGAFEAAGLSVAPNGLMAGLNGDSKEQ